MLLRTSDDEPHSDLTAADHTAESTRQSMVERIGQSSREDYPPPADVGRIGLAVARNNSKIVYAVIEVAGGGLFKSEDGGQTWKKINDANPRPTYFSKVHVDPTNDNRIFVLGGSLLISDDGGKTFVSNVVTRIHGDFHAMWIDPADADHMMLGSDGGIAISWDRAKTMGFHQHDSIRTVL